MIDEKTGRHFQLLGRPNWSPWITTMDPRPEWTYLKIPSLITTWPRLFTLN